MSAPGDLRAWWDQLIQSHDERSEALHAAYQAFENAGLINRVVVTRYICQKAGCKLGTVVRVNGLLVLRTTDYKFSPGMNQRRSVAAARAKNTLDGVRHWPGHTFDVAELAEWGPTAGMDMNCRHGLRTVLAQDALAAASDVVPGRPGAPIRI